MTVNLKRLVIYGAGALGHEIAEYACDAYKWNISDINKIIFIDDTPGLKSHNSCWDVVCGLSNYQYTNGDKFLIGIGDPNSRRSLFQLIEENNYEFATLVHPTSYISKSAEILPGTIISPFCAIGTKSILSKNLILNTYSAIGHHVRIGHSCVISPKVLIAGSSSIGECVFIGSNAVITPKTEIGSGTVIAAGSVVYRNCGNNFMIAGNPAKSYKM
jgi:sugar O-acyltransferase (sialic acid O-acetyltransferase NeuD family)